MEGVTRVLYRLPEIRMADEVWVVEGEKDVESLRDLGMIATCNVGGAGKWLDAYTATLTGKVVILCGDNDEPGRQHIDKVLASISDSAKAVKVVKVPDAHKDVSDWIAAAGPDAEVQLEKASEAATVVGGYHLIPVKNMAELELEYSAFAKRMDTASLDISRWLPSLTNKVRPIVPGELVMFLADTGTGKTALLQNLAMQSKITTLLFEMELPGTLTFERFIAAAGDVPCYLIEEAYRHNEVGQFKFEKLKHVWCCNQAGLKVEDMKRLIKASALKIGEPPVMVMVDYVQLVADTGRTRYERVSNAAEQLKVLAKETNTIVVAASQVGRKDYTGGPQIGLHDGKNAGEIENSSGLIFGCWRDEQDAMALWLKVLKNTKGRAGQEVCCNFNGSTMRITERSKIVA
jgi:5S rRNA maturation endonuclease (ribonuclease M5)